jgi:hypothetical protein
VVQTGAKMQLGGVKDGLARFAYQAGIAGFVKTEPTKPASWQTIMLIASFTISINFIFPTEALFSK